MGEYIGKNIKEILNLHEGACLCEEGTVLATLNSQQRPRITCKIKPASVSKLEIHEVR